jgi:hypothetical protein
VYSPSLDRLNLALKLFKVDELLKSLTKRPMFKLIQTDLVSERMKPPPVKISLRDGNEFISIIGSHGMSCIPGLLPLVSAKAFKS